jgi:sporulation protein YlmC with PRC-barrel domain
MSVDSPVVRRGLHSTLESNGVEREEANRSPPLPHGFFGRDTPMSIQMTRCSAAAALFVTAGLALTAWAQPTAPRSADGREPIRSESAKGSHIFLDAASLEGDDVANANGEVVASIDDFIVDRGSGRIEYAILNSGSVLGLGGKDIAVPYAALRYDPAKERYTINLTKEQIERAASFSPEDWSNLEHTTWTEDLENWWDETFADEDNDDDWNDPYTDSFASAKAANQSPTTIEGEITRVVREHKGNREHACVDVKDSDGNVKHVVLGPSWYVMGGAAAPMRGDTIKVEAVPSAADGKESYIALQATIEGERIDLRDKDGMARWDAPTKHGKDGMQKDEMDRRDASKSKESEARYTNRRWGTGQLILMSKLEDAPASASDKSGGEIQQVIIEERSGQIAFIGFDPNENVLGIADEIILVPWTLVSVGANHEARIDGSRDMLVASEEVPDDLDTLSEQNRLSAIYTAYGIDAPEFRSRSGEREMTASQWKSDGAFMKAFREGQERTIRGRIVEVRDESLIQGEPDAIVVVVDTETGEQRVVIGPSWYVSRQKFDFKPGDTINVTGNTGTFNGVEHIGARSVKSGDRTIVLWSDDDGVWNDD